MKNNPRGSERRQFGRRKSCLHGWICASGRARIPCVVRNITEGGALLEVDKPGVLPFNIRLILDTAGIEIDCEIKHVLDAAVGVSFADDPQAGSSTKNCIADLIKARAAQSV